MLPLAILAAAEAVGMVVDFFGMQNEIALSRMGAQLNQAAINANIVMTKVQAEDATIASIKTLRQTLGSQAAIMAARGTRGGTGSALTIMEDSIMEQSSDQRNIMLNALMKETQLKGQGVMSQIDEIGFESKKHREFFGRSIDRIGTTAFYGAGGTGGAAKATGGMGGGTALSSGASRYIGLGGGRRGGFGMTPAF